MYIILEFDVESAECFPTSSQFQKLQLMVIDDIDIHSMGISTNEELEVDKGPAQPS